MKILPKKFDNFDNIEDANSKISTLTSSRPSHAPLRETEMGAVKNPYNNIGDLEKGF